MRQLDGLRAVAIGLVLVSHWIDVGLFPWGDVGVQLFFVLSGFLITGILLNCRDHGEGTTASRFKSLRSFYIRRFLRIFPVYYLVLALCLLFGLSIIRDTFLWHALYLSNFYITFAADRSCFPINHFWTLSVEEQFYLVWPWLALFLKDRHLKWAIVVMILIGPMSRILGETSDIPFVRLRLLPSASLDSLGYGALLAYLRWKSPETPKSSRGTNIRTLACIGAGTLLLFHFLGMHGRINHCAGNLALSFVLGWVVWRAAMGFGSPVKLILENRSVVYLGKISYGIYIFHNFATYLYSKALIYYQLSPAFAEIPIRAFFLATLTVLAAAISWHFYERPINKLKRLQPY
jgi:peptidoglycan/LPS O-acetylase OafA/YrhL